MQTDFEAMGGIYTSEGDRVLLGGFLPCDNGNHLLQ